MKIKTTTVFKFFKILESIIFPLYLSGQASAELLDTCHSKEYPELHAKFDVAEFRSSDNKLVRSTVFQTIPLSKVYYATTGIYLITHPNPTDECTEVKDFMFDSSPQMITLKKWAKKHPFKRKYCSVTIVQITTAGTTSDWTIFSTNF